MSHLSYPIYAMIQKEVALTEKEIQIELEIQNEELHLSQAELEAVGARKNSSRIY